MIADSIKRNLDVVEEEIEKAAGRSGRKRSDIKLLVVSKAQPADKIRAAYASGARYFGENYPEETAGKIPLLGDLADVEWHMIGHLQSRKAKIVVDEFDMLHSLDNLHTAEKLERLLAEKGLNLPVLIEINTGGEESKSGLSFSDEEEEAVIYDFIIKLQNFSHLKPCGLMTMPPLESDANQARGYFQRLRGLIEKVRAAFPEMDWKELSMGTSADFSVAIEEGATMIRVGHAILGERIYT